MHQVLIINGHRPSAFSPGALNSALTERAADYLQESGYAVTQSAVAEAYDVDAEIARHQAADIVLMQFPVNWMGVSWAFKKYMDDVYTAGMDGRLTAGDGRAADSPKANYGQGGALTGTRYMLSVTLNAPREAFDDPNEPFFAGKSIDDLLWPQHLNARFFGMTPLPTFAAYDVLKNPTIEDDFIRFDAHLRAALPAIVENAA